MIRFLALFCMVFFLSTQQGLAEDGFDPAAQEVGAVTRWSHKFGTRQLTYLGQDDIGNKYEWRNKTGGQELVFFIWRNSDGQNIRLEGGDEVQTYAPHNCRLTVGRCEYVYSYEHKAEPDRQERRIVINSVDGDVWSFQQYTNDVSSENLKREGTFTVDDFGIVMDSGILKRIPAR